ncbi:ATP-binding protein [Streptomyces sp. 4N509B]|uniref:ATP-binding protein n=1 Tax=Streptomyces sp. 4N509B TaxID=3457413 RepID=UPI003FD3527F
MSTTASMAASSPSTSSPVRRFRLVAPNASDTPRLARDHVGYLLLREGLPELVDTARLLVTELASNVLQHTSARSLAVETTFEHGRVTVAVVDSSPGGSTAIRPPDVPPGAEADYGRGLMLVDRLADGWGVTVLHDARSATPVGKRVWFTLVHTLVHTLADS